MGFQLLLNLFFVSIIFCCFCFYYCTAIDSITSSQFIKDPETLSSNGGTFTLGFFSPESSTNRYVGIWFRTKSEVVWVANRNRPLSDSSGIFTISGDGNLVVLTAQKEIIWSSNLSDISRNSSAQLLDSGNLVLLDNTTGNTVWQSFQDPSDALLQTMKITSNKNTGAKVQLTCWKSPSDPSIGNFSAGLGRLSIPELFIWKETRPYWRSGPWDGRTFTGIPSMNSVYLNGFNLGVENEGEVYLSFDLATDFNLTVIFILDSQGILMQKDWTDEKEEWETTWTSKNSDCDIYGTCGAFGSCSSESSPICSCLRGFEPQNKGEWNRQNWTSGCVRKEDLQCEKVKNGSSGGKSDGFLRLRGVKVPDFAEWSAVLEDTCRSECLQNCSCMAYSFDEGIGCMSWSGNLIDIQQFSAGGIDFYIRAAYSELDKEKDLTVIITVTVIIGTIIIITGAYLFWKWTAQNSARKKMRKGFTPFKKAERYVNSSNHRIIGELSQVKLPEILQYDFEQLATATDNFHQSNKLGQGGFGPVYKGKLQDGREIAIKRLSEASGQGLEEFMNEVVVISELQHRNLVTLLGCCIEGDEKMLIYEYMPNRSLDAFIFDPPKHKLLDWRKRFYIIEGIARGLLYLHRDSRMKIIHRDLKASNILLDEEMNPKISDFGMAKIFEGREDQANTRRVVGTYGYMSPEYAMEGLFSEKSDVFSFGVLLLEIISGRKNSSFYHDEESLSLLGFAWKLWNEETIGSLIDQEIDDPCSRVDILRCIHIGLMCVQELARERPTMATVISMLNCEIANLPPPRQPGFILRQSMLNSVSSQTSKKLFSNNNVSMTEIQGR